MRLSSNQLGSAQTSSIKERCDKQTEIICVHIVISGFVQGVGFRPFVYRLANELHIKGIVSNNTGQVSVVAEANREVLELFCKRIVIDAPVNAKPNIQSISETDLVYYKDFAIKQSHELSKSDIHIQPDLPVCDQCLEELFDENNRRYLYPFINCTQCGPRYSIITSIPYDRKNTSMHGFPLCSDCESEYRSPHDRRFHAEPIACKSCGPVLNFDDGKSTITDNSLALKACVSALSNGEIIAVKGIGGYHLMCDATSSDAIRLLRNRKQRADKPFAVLMKKSQLENHVDVTKQELALLEHPSRPVVLLTRKNRHGLQANLAPGINRLGVMLPSNPLQHLICHHFGKPLVATSANVSGEPIITDNKEAAKRLVNLCDAFLHNNRSIVRPADDAVMTHNKFTSQILRSGRGLAPTEFTLPFTIEKPTLAVGGHIKNTIALAWDNRMVISAHNGDLGSLRGYQTFQQRIDDLQNLYKVNAEQIVCDVHPGYASTQWAIQSGLPVCEIHHHHAHASGVVLEGPEADNWLVFCWDGSGLGKDNSLWGGEAFLGKPGNWKRVSSFKTFRLPGGEKSSREAWRVAASLCWQSNIDFELNSQARHQFKEYELKKVWQKKLNCPESSAVGRLFSAAASLLGLVDIESYEGHGPMLLEALAETTTADGITLPVEVDTDDIARVDWSPLVKMLTDETLGKAYRARCFHETLAECISRISLQHSEEYKNITIGLSGGVFQNQLLVGLIRNRLDEHNLSIVMPVSIPVNDGGLCAGQIIEYHYQ